jgi:hypothetical protein
MFKCFEDGDLDEILKRMLQTLHKPHEKKAPKKKSENSQKVQLVGVLMGLQPWRPQFRQLPLSAIEVLPNSLRDRRQLQDRAWLDCLFLGRDRTVGSVT